jgi:D-beta-D-heptose 7-phosphate kinase/D-beta-D-heptose 1-phosphate adenosyltransferase
MTLFRNQSDPISIPTQAREVYDVTGAGDTVAATIAVALAVGRSLTTACHLASLAAAVVVGKLGTATCTYDELRSAVLSTQGPSVPSQE